MKKLALKYSLFAAIAIAFNLGSQRIVELIYHGPLKLLVALIIGTGIGLVVKYFLDKKFIFYYQVQNKTEDLRKFVIYSFMGLATTAIFWGFQLSFNFIFEKEYAKYAGGLIGLVIGYFVKYQLDKKFVFKK